MEEWGAAGMEPETIDILDESKMTKSKEEYIAEAGATDLYDAERGVVYTSRFYKDMHERYLEYMRSRQQEEESERTPTANKSPDFDDGDR